MSFTNPPLLGHSTLAVAAVAGSQFRCGHKLLSPPLANPLICRSISLVDRRRHVSTVTLPLLLPTLHRRDPWHDCFPKRTLSGARRATIFCRVISSRVTLLSAGRVPLCRVCTAHCRAVYCISSRRSQRTPWPRTRCCSSRCMQALKHCELRRNAHCGRGRHQDGRC